MIFAASALELAAQVPQNRFDPTGLAIAYPHRHLVHSTDPTREGATAHLRATDPFLFYQLGRDLVLREYKLAEGTYGRPAAMNIPLYVSSAIQRAKLGADVRFARDHAGSCGLCHSAPYREPGSGQTIPSTSGMGRNTPHFFGAGLMEMIGDQATRKILRQYDTNGNGIIDRTELKPSMPARVVPAVGVPPIDYGDLAPDAAGVPRLNPAFRIWYVNARGDILPSATSLQDPGVAGFGFSLQVFGWGRGFAVLSNGRRVAQGAEASTIRGIFAAAADLHLGMQAFDPAQQLDGTCEGSRHASAMGGYAAVSLNGMQQYDFGGSVDCGAKRTGNGLSLDDPDQDGRISEFTEGDLDAIEYYLLNAPPPSYLNSAAAESGRKLFASVGCLHCHIENWRLESRDKNAGFAGDRRTFDFAVQSANGAGMDGLRGALTMLASATPAGKLPKGGAYRVRQIFTDFKQWDIGPLYYERRFDGSLQREHRTAPLWGVGSTAPYGHAGQFATLEEAILAHGGNAEGERRAFRALSPQDQRRVIVFLKSLVLYPTEEIPADIDGDGKAAENFLVAGQAVGYERFNAQFLFRNAPQYQRLFNVTDYQGRLVPLLIVKNMDEAYGLTLEYRRDSVGDGYPDVLRPAPALVSRSRP